MSAITRGHQLMANVSRMSISRSVAPMLHPSSQHLLNNTLVRPLSSKTPDSPASTNGTSLDSSEAKPLGKVSGIVNSILHGSGSLPKIQSQESWGVSLARGKYVHELQKHRIRPERFDDYVQLV
ncbi:hypothetical protein BGZ94_003482, partial [Podila epigama]